jgi:alpha-ribazole phosphatase
MQIYLVRHTTPFVKAGTCYGQSDIPLNKELFPKESAQVISKLPAELDIWYSSPLQRCTQLAHQICASYQTDTRLMELNFGQWEMQKWDQIDADSLKKWSENFVEIHPPHGENYLDLHARSEAFIASLLAQNSHKAGIVTHAGNIRSILSWVLGLPLENSFRISLSYGAVVCVEIHLDKHYNKLISIQ